MPPHEPSASCRSRIHRTALATARRRSGRTGWSSKACSTRSKTRQKRLALTFGGGVGPCSSATPKGSGRVGRRLATTVSGTMVCRAQQAKS